MQNGDEVYVTPSLGAVLAAPLVLPSQGERVDRRGGRIPGSARRKRLPPARPERCQDPHTYPLGQHQERDDQGRLQPREGMFIIKYFSLYLVYVLSLCSV